MDHMRHHHFAGCFTKRFNIKLTQFKAILKVCQSVAGGSAATYVKKAIGTRSVFIVQADWYRPLWLAVKHPDFKGKARFISINLSLPAIFASRADWPPGPFAIFAGYVTFGLINGL